jgi:hypothetical protein
MPARQDLEARSEMGGIGGEARAAERPMSTSVQWDPEAGVAVVAVTGRLGVNEAKGGASTVWQTPGWRGHPVVWDLRGAELDFSTADVRVIARFVLDRQPDPPPSKVGFVVARDLDFGLARMYEVFREHPATELRVFRDLDEAMAWARSGPAGSP